jgi:hypothetical protein
VPGSDARGIPELLEMAFDADGRLVSDLEVHSARVG